ncbi:MAG: hypothetical protein U0359_17045 [Byssovorax sp.]
MILPRLLSLAALAGLLLGTSCRYDPVPQAIIDSLPPDDGEPGPNHRPGQPCNVCHSAYGGATPVFAVAGTAFTKSMDGKLVPAANVAVTLRDSAGGKRPACTKTSGNFYIEADNWDTITYPLSATVGDRSMSSLIGREGSCASCHKLPDENSIDPVTGAGHDSPGVILVDVTAPGASCGGGGM